MDNEKFQKLIDLEKPAFDYARMFLTAIAWCTLLIIVATAMIKSEPSLVSYMIATPVFTIGGIFGIFLLFRIGALSERIAEAFLHQSKSLPLYFRIPINIFASLIPLSSAWLITWALMFNSVTG